MAIMNQTDSHTRIAHVFSGTFVHSTPRAAVEILQNCVLGVDDKGKVCLVLHYCLCHLMLIYLF